MRCPVFTNHAASAPASVAAVAHWTAFANTEWFFIVLLPYWIRRALDSPVGFAPEFDINTIIVVISTTPQRAVNTQTPDRLTTHGKA
jgi:hypothetical protein